MILDRSLTEASPYYMILPILYYENRASRHGIVFALFRPRFSCEQKVAVLGQYMGTHTLFLKVCLTIFKLNIPIGVHECLAMDLINVSHVDLKRGTRIIP